MIVVSNQKAAIMKKRGGIEELLLFGRNIFAGPQLLRHLHHLFRVLGIMVGKMGRKLLLQLLH